MRKMVKTLLQILAYELRLCFRLVTEPPVRTDETGSWLLTMESDLSLLEGEVPQQYRQLRSMRVPDLLSRYLQ